MDTDEKLSYIKDQFNSVKSKSNVKIDKINYREKLTDIKNNINSIKNKSQPFKILDKTINKSKNGFSVISNATKRSLSKANPILNKGSEKIESLVNDGQIKKFLNMILYISLLIIIVIQVTDIESISFNLKKIIRNLLYSLILVFFVNDIIPLIADDSNLAIQLFILVLLGISTYFFMKFIDDLIEYRKIQQFNSPFLIEGLQVGTNSTVISQNPNNPEAILLYPSKNEPNGIEFSYQVWIIVKGTNFKGSKNDPLKHIFHKGDYTGKITQCPSLYLHPDINALRINVNTLDSKDNFIDIHNIPLDKWLHITIVLKQNKFEVFINGSLKNTKLLTSLPRQNYGDVWVNLNGGFDGYLSKLRYHRYALHYTEIEKYSKDKPNSTGCLVSTDRPSYLNKDWWLSNSFSD